MQTSEIISSLLDYFTASAAYLRYLVKDNANERNKYQACLIISQRVPLIFANNANERKFVQASE